MPTKKHFFQALTTNIQLDFILMRKNNAERRWGGACCTVGGLNVAKPYDVKTGGPDFLMHDFYPISLTGFLRGKPIYQPVTSVLHQVFAVFA